MHTPNAPAKPPDAGSTTAATGSEPARPKSGKAAAPAEASSAIGSFTVLPSLQRVASGPVCENGVCYVPGAAPGEDAPKKA